MTTYKTPMECEKDSGICQISVNGQSMEINIGEGICNVIDRCGFNANLVAVAVNQVFISRANRADTPLQSGDQIEIVSPMVGG